MHSEFLLVDNGKMSKSLGNTYTIANLVERGYNPIAFRYFCMNAHYRSKLNFTWDSLQAAQVSYDRLLEGALSHKNSSSIVEDDVVETFKREFEEAVNDDLNIPKALGIVWNIVRYGTKSIKLLSCL